MEQLEKAFTILQNPAQYSPQIQQEAQEYFNNVVENCYQDWQKILQEALNMKNDNGLRFWMLQSLINIANKKLPDFPPEQKELFYNVCMQALSANAMEIMSEPYLRNKYVMLLAAIYDKNTAQSQSMHQNLLEILSHFSKNNQPAYMAGCALIMIHVTLEILKSTKGWNGRDVNELDFIQRSFTERGLPYVKQLAQNLLSPECQSPVELVGQAIKVVTSLAKDGDFNDQEIEEFQKQIVKFLQSPDLKVAAYALKFQEAYFARLDHYLDLQIKLVQSILPCFQQWVNCDNYKLFYAISKFLNSVFYNWSYFMVKRKEKKHPHRRRLHLENGDDMDEEEFDHKKSHHFSRDSKKKLYIEEGQKVALDSLLKEIYVFSVEVFKVNSSKTGNMVVDIFSNYFRNVWDREIDQQEQGRLLAIIELIDSKMEYPPTFNMDVVKAQDMSDEEESFKEFRSNLKHLLRVLLEELGLEALFVQKLDQKIASMQQLDVRKVETLLAFVHILIQHNQYSQAAGTLWKRYEEVIFNPSVLQLQCPPISETLNELFVLIDLSQLNEVQIKLLVRYLFSPNGILSENFHTYNLANQLFIQEFNKQGTTIFTPYINDILVLISDSLFTNLGLLADRKHPFNMNTFQILGMLLCNDAIDPLQRQKSLTVFLDQIQQLLKQLAGEQKKLRMYLQVLKQLIKGIGYSVLPEQETTLLHQVFEAMLMMFQGKFNRENSLLVLNLLKDKFTVFKDKAFLLYETFFPMVPQSATPEIAAEFFSILHRFKVSYETESLLNAFVQRNFQALVDLLANKFGNLQQITSPADQDTQKAVEEVLKLLHDALYLDYNFIFSHGEPAFECFIRYLLAVIETNFTVKVRALGMKCLTQVLVQFYQYGEQKDFAEKSMKRQKLNYQPLPASSFPQDHQVSKSMGEILESCCINYIGLTGHLQVDWETFFANIPVLQHLFMTLDEGNQEKMRWKMKNEKKYLYAFVLENMKLLRKYQAGEISKRALESQFINALQRLYEEQELRSIV